MTDPNFERSLRAAARRGRPGGVHPDASLLAAYVDRGLSDTERAALEAHVADCADCMERLALLGSVNVPDEPATPSFDWSPRQLLPRWGWLVPVATIVVLVAVWERQPTAPVRATAAPPAAEQPSAVPAPSVPQATNQPEERDARKQPARSADAGLANEAQKAPARQFAQAPKAKDATVRPEMQARARETAPQPGAVPGGGSEVEDRRALGDKKVDAVAPVPSNVVAGAPAPAAAPTPGGPPAQAEAASAAVGGRADETKASDQAARAVPPRSESVSQGALLKSEVEGPVVLATGSGASIRRVGSRLERSTDNGATWTLDLSDAPAGLHVGSCPAAAVCWLGGARGVVVVRQPSGTWTHHVVADGRAAVTAIESTDAVTARVHLSDGRSFRTSDGGSSWELAGNQP